MKLIQFHLAILIILVLGNINMASAQSAYAPINEDYNHLIDRFDIIGGEFSDEIYTDSWPIKRADIAHAAENMLQDTTLSEKEKESLRYLVNDNWEFADTTYHRLNKPLFNTFYKVSSDAYYHQSKDFNIHISPIFHFGGGIENSDNEEDPNLFINRRGIELRGTVDQKVGFYTKLVENQVIYPSYIRSFVDSNNAVPEQNHWKPFKDGDGYDFFTAQGYINFHLTKHIETQFGHGKNRFGNGFRSLILSDFAGNYTYLRLNTKVWKFHYTNIYSQMHANIDLPGRPRGDVPFDTKYFVLHYLSIKPIENLTLGFFESITYGGSINGTQRNFNIAYANPIIFYRSVEQNLGSDGNALMGLNLKWNFLNHFSLYGQLALDEFNISQWREKDNWWGNKYSFQIGGKYINAFGIAHLDLQGEYNFIRPYMYTHRNNLTSYTHFNQPLAHPNGANLTEYVGIVRYRPIFKLSLAGKAILLNKGKDAAGENWGGDVLKSYITRESNEGNTVAQGNEVTTLFAELEASYMLFHNFFLDWNLVAHRSTSENKIFQFDSYLTTFAIRWNIARAKNEF